MIRHLATSTPRPNARRNALAPYRRSCDCEGSTANDGATGTVGSRAGRAVALHVVAMAAVCAMAVWLLRDASRPIEDDDTPSGWSAAHAEPEDLPRCTVRASIAPDDVARLGARRWVLSPTLSHRTSIAVPRYVDVAADGRFSFEVPCIDRRDVDGFFVLEAWPADDTWPSLDRVPMAAFFVRGATFRSGSDVPKRLVATISNTGLESLTDAELQADWNRMMRLDRHGRKSPDGALAGDSESDPDDQPPLGKDPYEGGVGWDRLPLEILRRNDGKWIDLLTHDARIRPPAQGNFAQLGILTALRRLRQQPDPVAIRFLTGTDRVVEFPDMPVLRVQLENVDAEGLPIAVTSHMYDQWGVETRLPDGLPAFATHAYALGSSGVREFGDLVLGHGQSRVVLVKVREQYNPLPLGKVQLRVHYVDHGCFWDARLGSTPVVTFRSEPIDVEVRPRVLTLDRHRVRELEKALLAIGPRDPFVMSKERAAWADDFDEPARTPADKLIQGGMASIGVLLAHVDDTSLAPHQQLRLFGLLSTLTGMFVAEPDPTVSGAPSDKAIRDPECAEARDWLRLRRATWAPYRGAILLRIE